MKNLIFILMLAIFALGTGNARAEDYLIESGYFGDLIIGNNDTLLMTGGWGDNLSIIDYAVATIENTDLPIGITNLSLSGYGIVNIYGGGMYDVEADSFASINMTGGSVNTLEMHYKSMSYMYGGAIGTLASDQPSGYPLPQNWIHVYCLEYDYDSNNNLLTGLWGDSSSFNIQLDDIGAIPTYEQIEFHVIPEPASIIFLGLGGLLLRHN